MPYRADRPCPACGGVVEFDSIDVRTWGMTGPTFVPGRAHCRTSECDPRFRRVVVASDRRAFESVCMDMGWNPRVVRFVMPDDVAAVVGLSVPEHMITILCAPGSQVLSALHRAALSAEGSRQPFPPTPRPVWVEDEVSLRYDDATAAQIARDMINRSGLYQETEQVVEAFTTAHGEMWVRYERRPLLGNETRRAAEQDYRDRSREFDHQYREVINPDRIQLHYDDRGRPVDLDPEFLDRERVITETEAEFRRPSAPEFGHLIEDHGQDAMRSNPHTTEGTFRL